MDICDFLNKTCGGTWSLNYDDPQSVNVDGNVLIYNMNLTELPVQFGKVNGSFQCSFNKLTSLKGCPKYVIGFSVVRTIF